MKGAEKYANSKFGGMTTMTLAEDWCKHRDGWYVTVRFWIFSKRIFVCSDCGHHHEVQAIGYTKKVSGAGTASD